MKELKLRIAAAHHRAVPIFEDAPCYPKDLLRELFLMNKKLVDPELPEDEAEALLSEYIALTERIGSCKNEKEKIMLWPEGVLPSVTEYTENIDYAFNHDPDFLPYMYEMLLPEGTKNKGAVLVCAGGDHGECVAYEGLQVCLDMNAMGYQAFLLLNRTNRRPWGGLECGADTSRAIRYIRANAEKYGITDGRVAYAGFSNGGLTGEFCIRYFSGEQKMTDHFPGYIPDALDEYYGAPDAFLCVYGPRFVGVEFDFEKVIYPPTFFAVGREDFSVQNLYWVLPGLIEHGVDIEIHTFAGVPHGAAGAKFFGEPEHPTFEYWNTLADVFMQDVYRKKNV